MTTFNITRNNDQANSNVLFIGIALVAIVAVLVAFAPALFSSSSIAVEGAPFGNGSNDGNFTVTTLDGRVEGTSPNLTMYPTTDGTSIITSSQTWNISCTAFEAPSPLDAAGNYIYYSENGITIAYSSTAGAIVVIEKDVIFYFDISACTWGKQLIPS